MVWGLRNYGKATNTIWDGDPNCEHEGSLKKSGFCKKCGAWYGQLGLEPTLDMYIEHMLQITVELKRVLKPSGVCFWNHGDNYSTGCAHFATFPERLVEPMIKAGCPAEICKKCGKARVRIVRIEHRPNRPTASPLAKTNRDITGKINRASFYKDYRQKEFLGWTDCGCNAGFEPGVVLDPFMGSGTTAVVALKLGRRYIGIELNPEYIEIAKRRIKAVSGGLFNAPQKCF